MTQVSLKSGSGGSGESSDSCKEHEYECTPIAKQDASTVADKAAELLNGPKAGDPFESRCVTHNQEDIQSASDIGCDFRCKNCSLTKEVDHVTRDTPGGPIRKIVQCKSDQSKKDGAKGAIIKYKQLREDRKLREAIESCQPSEPPPKIEYKLESGEAAQESANFLRKKDPPLITFVD